MRSPRVTLLRFISVMIKFLTAITIKEKSWLGNIQLEWKIIKVKEFSGTIHTKRKGQKEELLEGTSFIWAENHWLFIRAGWGPQTFFWTHDNQLLSLSGVHGLKDYLCSAHLHGSFDGRIYSLEHFHKSKFVQQRTQEGGHYRGNPWNHELLTVRGVDYRASKKMFWGVIPVLCSTIESKISIQKLSLIINNKVGHNISPVLLYDVGAGPECGHLYIYPPH